MYEVIAPDQNENPVVVFRTESFGEAHVVRAKFNGWIKEVYTEKDRCNHNWSNWQHFSEARNRYCKRCGKSQHETL